MQRRERLNLYYFLDQLFRYSNSLAYKTRATGTETIAETHEAMIDSVTEYVSRYIAYGTAR